MPDDTRSLPRVYTPNTPTWWRPGDPVDEYRWDWQRRDAKKLEALSEILAVGGLKSIEEVQKYSKTSGMAVRSILFWKRDKVMTTRVKELIKLNAIYGAAAALPHQIEAAKLDVGAFKAVLQVAEIGQSPGGRVNVAIDARKMGDTHSDRMFFEEYQKRVEANATVVDDGSTTQ